MGRREKLDDYFDGWLILALNVPALVTIILCFIWFGLNEVAAILAVAINKIPTVTVILREGTKALNEKLIDVGKIYNLKRSEIVKEILGIGKTLCGYILIINTLNLSFRKVKLNKRSDCFCNEK